MPPTQETPGTVGAQTVQKFFYTSTEVTSALKTVAQFGTFTLQARCNGAKPDLELTSSENDWDTGGTMTDVVPTDHSLYHYNLGAGTTVDLTAGGNENGGYVTGVTPSGHTITITYQVDNGPALGTDECDESGVAIGS